MGSKLARMMLLYFVGEHLQDVLLLEDRFDSDKGEVLLVSVKSEDSMAEWKEKRLKLCYFVCLECICKIFCCLSIDFIVLKSKCC